VQEDDELQLRNGQVLHLSFGANGKESYAQLPNPFYGKALEQGATLSFWVRRTDDTNLWDAFYGFYDPASKARLYMTGNCYTGYNDNAGTYLDINHPETVQPTFLKGTRWHLVTVVFNRSTLGVRLYVDGSLKSGSDKFAGKQNDKEVTARTGFDYNAIVDHLAKCQNFYLGYGSFWGSADAVYDDVTFHDRALEMAEVQALSLMYNRVYNLEQLNPASVPYTAIFSQSTTERLYDLQGRRIDGQPRPGLYIRGGKKYLIK
jgi:arabinan endo-1,5-alpha-L-arabinosidase